MTDDTVPIYENKPLRKSDSYWLNLYKVHESRVFVDRLDIDLKKTLDQKNNGEHYFIKNIIISFKFYIHTSNSCLRSVLTFSFNSVEKHDIYRKLLNSKV